MYFCKIIKQFLRKLVYNNNNMEKAFIPTEIYAESTPNPNAVKFVLNRNLVEGDPIEFKFGSEAKNSPLVQDLFNFPFVLNVFVSTNFITITKTQNIDWTEIIPQLRNFISEYFNSGKELFSKVIVTNKNTIVEDVPDEQLVPTSEIEIKIAEILDEYIRPAVEGDGGAIVLKSFKNGTVTVKMQGSCSGCPSSTMTLKAGIEGLLKRLVPEVEQVISE